MKMTIIFMAVAVGLIAGVCFVLADTKDKREALRGISVGCFCGAFLAIFIL
jgi:hypothetical protein